MSEDKDVDMKDNEEEVDDEDKGKKKGPAKIRKIFEVKKWNAVALWTYDIVVDTCAICRNHIMELCSFHALFRSQSLP
jgi:RING-box protein 1